MKRLNFLIEDEDAKELDDFRYEERFCLSEAVRFLVKTGLETVKKNKAQGGFDAS